MKRIIVLLALSLGLSLWFIKSNLDIRAWASAGGATSKRLPLKQAASNGHLSASVHAAGRGNPLINLRDGSDLEAAYNGPAELKRALVPGRSMPLSLATGDYDEDGVTDVISGYSTGRFETDSSVLALYRDNADSIYPNSPEAQNHKIRGEFIDSPFHPSSVVIDVPEAPDYLGTGDFDADGHLDIVVATVLGQSLYVLGGDGRGGFNPARALNLPGRLTALATGEINRADGLTDIVVGIEGGDGPHLLIFEGPQGAINSEPESLQLHAEATTLALGQLDDGYALDLAVGAGSELLVLHGRDRGLSLGTTRRSEAPPAIISRQLLSFRVQSLAVGTFAGNDQTDIAVLSEDGEVRVLQRPQDGSATQKPEDADRKSVSRTDGDATTGPSSNSMWRESSALSLPGSVPLPSLAAPCLLVAARVSSLPTDDLVVIDPNNNQLHILTSHAETRVPNNQAIASTSASSRSLRVSASLDVEGEPMAVVPMRLNSDALNDLVILRVGAQGLTVTPSAALSTITVNDTADSNIRDSVLTLREAIMLAEGTLLTGSLTVAEQAQVTGTPAAGQEDEIRFNIPGTAPYTINVVPAGLPAITAAGGALTIDGTTQPSFVGMPLIELNGTGVISPGGLTVSAGDSTVRGLVINRFISGILVSTNGNNVFEGNFIGTDVTGNTALGNSSSGIFITVASNNTRIGGTTAAARNIISGNVGGGIAMFSSTGIVVQGNFIGTNATGTAVLGNSSSGIRVSSNSNNTTIGGTAAGALNLISGTIGTGIQIDSSNSGNLVQGNLIGTDITGTLDFGNQTGIAIGSPNNTIGGTTSAARNLISGNNINGIVINGGLANANLVQGNFIGTDATGTADLGNSLHGVDINVGTGNTVGGTATGAGNLISGNNLHGVNLGSSGNFVQGNLIGTQLNGTSPLGNSLVGVLVVGLNNNAIGGIDPGAGNIIAFNGDDGVQVSGSGHAIRRNSIFSNGTTIQHLGIDLSGDGVTANDNCDLDPGSNNLQNFPVITSASSSGVSTTIVGTLNSTPGTTFTIEFYANASCDASGNGEGQTFLGSTAVTTAASPDCSASFNVTFGSAPSGQNVVTATATDPSGNTSEFSQCITAPVECTITCPQNQTVNTGPGSTQCGATINYPAATTGGSCGTVTCVPSSGSFFLLGTTTVNCTTTSGPSCSFTLTVVDNTPPTITCPNNITQSTDPNVCTALVTFSSPTATDNCSPAPTVACSPASGSSFNKGTTTVTCTATDSSKNTAMCSFTVMVNDTQAPTITCPSNTTTSTSASCAVVSYPAATVSDNCSGATASCSPASGGCFPLGTTTVNCTATDASGNQASCTFTVTVTQTTCTITCPPNIAKPNDPNQCGAVVTYSAPTATGTCGTVVCSPASGSFFPVGATTVTCKSNSNAGPESCAFIVAVNDTQPPTITCPANINTAGASSCLFATTSRPVNFSVAASDNCPGVTVACKNQNDDVVTSGATFPVGTTTVTCTATDSSGNTATCSFNVTAFSACLQDDSNPSLAVLFNLQTGQYQFCCGGTLFSGTGTVTVKGCVVTIQHNTPARRVLIRFEGSANVGSASLQSPPGRLRCSIRDTDTRNNSCVCP